MLRALDALVLAATIFAGTGQPLGPNLQPLSWSVPYNFNPFTAPLCVADPCTPSQPIDPNSTAQLAFIMQTMVGAFALGEIQQRDPSTDGTVGISGSYPVYWASTADPVYTISCDGGTFDCQNSPATLNIPNGARAAGTADHHLVVIEPGNVEYAFDQFNDNGTGTGTTKPVFFGGSVSVKSGGVATSLTMYTAGGACTTCNASMAAFLPAQPGLLDPAEIVAGNIPHTIDVALFCPSSTFFWPANKSDGPCSQGPGEGEYIWLTLTDAQIRALGFCSWETTLLLEMHHYGLLIGDTGGGPEPWDFKSYDDWSEMTYGGVGGWSKFWTWLSSSCPSAVPAFSGGSSHMQLLTTGILQSNLEILE